MSKKSSESIQSDKEGIYGGRPSPTWGRSLGSYDEVGSVDIAKLRFMSEVTGEVFAVDKQYTTSASLLAIADLIAAQVGGSVNGIYPHSLVVVGNLNKHPVFAVVAYGERASSNYNDDNVETVRQITVNLSCHREAHKALFEMLDNSLARDTYTSIKWWYKDEGRPSYKTVYLPPLTTKLLPEFYPDMQGDPADFIRSFIKSDAAILLLAGPAGTGKTTFLRHMICDHKLDAHVVYDEQLMSSDSVFQNFLFEKNSDVLIIEDADTILSDRENQNNKLMARFLNVSDGLIKLPDKKLVFTTNLSDFNKVDPALTRPGRCYGVLHTRHLNLTEAQAAARAANLPVPIEKREYTLAELFNQSQKQHAIRRIGFSAG